MKIIFAIILSLVSTVCFAGEFKTESYEEAVSKKDIKVLVIMGADWCRYCVKLKSDLKDMNLSDYVVTIVDIDKRPDLKKEYKVSTLPTSFIVFNGEKIDKKVGYDKNSYTKWLKENENLYGKSIDCCEICCKCDNCVKEKCSCCSCNNN